MTPDDPRDPRTGTGGGTPPPDEIASALIDGLLDADAEAEARSRPDVMARVEAMAAARRALRALPVPPHAGRHRALAAALAAFDDDAPHQDEAGGHRAASPAGAAPPRAGVGAPRGGEARRAPRWLAPAAAVAVLLGLAGLVVATADPGRDDADEATEAAGGSAEHEDEEPAAQDEAHDGATGAPLPGDAEGGEMADRAGDLGSFATEEALAARVAEAVANGDARQELPLDTGSGPACGSDPPPLAAALAVVLRGQATLGGRGVEVWVVDTAGGRRLLALALEDTCEVLVDRPLG